MCLSCEFEKQIGANLHLPVLMKYFVDLILFYWVQRTLLTYLLGPQVCVLVHSGCYCNKILLTGCLIEDRNLFFTVVETGSQIRVSVGLGKALPGFRLLIPSHCRRSNGPLWNLFYQAPIPFTRISHTPPHDLVTPPSHHIEH